MYEENPKECTDTFLQLIRNITNTLLNPVRVEQALWIQKSIYED